MTEKQISEPSPKFNCPVMSEHNNGGIEGGGIHPSSPNDHSESYAKKSLLGLLKTESPNPFTMPDSGSLIRDTSPCKDFEDVICIGLKFEDVHSSSSELDNNHDLAADFDTESETSEKSALNYSADSDIRRCRTSSGSYGIPPFSQNKFYISNSTETINSSGRTTPEKCRSYHDNFIPSDKVNSYMHGIAITSKKLDACSQDDGVRWLCLRRRFIWIRNNIQSLGFMLLFIAVNAILFLTRAYQYRNANILHIGARACGQCLNFDCALLLGLILRRTVTRLRNSALGRFLPCDRHIYFHKLAGWTVFVFSVLHTIFHLANFAGISEHTGISVWSYLWDTNLGIGWIWGLANPTGVVLLFMLCIIAAFSHRCVRKSGKFEIFYWTHLLSLPFWVLLVIHGPNCWKWLFIPGSAFLLENIARIVQRRSSRGRTAVVSTYSFTSHVTKLVIRKPRELEFRAGEYVYLNIPSVARYEWHPFTISSAPEEDDVFMVHIRAVGGWTDKVYELFQARNIDEERPRSPFSLTEREKKLSIRGLFNLGFDSSSEDDWKGRGSRYVENLKEFNRRLSSSMGSYKSMEEDLKPKQHEAPLSRKKSCSLGSLSNSSKEFCKSGGPSTPESGRSSRTESCCSLQEHTVEEHREPVVLPPTIVLESPDGIKSDIGRRGSRNDTKIWMRLRSPEPEDSEGKQKAIEIYVDGPYGSPSSNIFNVSHAVLIGAGIGVTPFASILQSVMHRYREAKIPCPHCKVSSCVALPSTLHKLRKVDFIWVNRDLRHFEWFLELLANLEEEQSVQGAAMERFLRIHLYKTGNEPLQFPIPLASVIHNGRPNWDKLLASIRESRVGHICVYYCGPPALATVLRERCLFHHLDFRKEMF